MTQWHNKPNWAAPMFKEPIQGVKVGDTCTFPSYDEVAAKHSGPGIAMTIGESNPETCAGIMYFGAWTKHLRQAEKNAEAAGGRTDTVKFGSEAKFLNDACQYLGQPNTETYVKWTVIDGIGVFHRPPPNLPVDTLLFSGRVEFVGRMYYHAPTDSWCGEEDSSGIIRAVYFNWYAPTSPAMTGSRNASVMSHNGYYSSPPTTIGYVWATSLPVQRSCLAYFQGPQTISLSNSPYIKTAVTFPTYMGGGGNGNVPANTYECGDHSLPITFYTYAPSQYTSLP